MKHSMCSYIIRSLWHRDFQTAGGRYPPSVRQLADEVGINMHTVNKAYSLLKQEGYIRLDRRYGAVIAVDADKLKAMEDMKQGLLVLLAKGSCKTLPEKKCIS